MRLLLTMIAAALLTANWAHADDKADIAAVLDQLHKTAAAGDWDSYYPLYAAGATFIGTDVTEFWTIDELAAYAKARGGKGWVYRPIDRQIDITPDGNSAYFHETLGHDQLSISRGTGVLIRTEKGWRIAQYHLTVPIPNALLLDVANEIKAQK